MSYTYKEKLSRRITQKYVSGKIDYKAFAKLIEMYWAKYGKTGYWTNRQ